MSRAALLLLLPLLACSRKDDAAVDTSAMTAAASGMNIAGKWSVRVMPEGKDTTLLYYMLDATNSASGWKMTLPNRQPMDVKVVHMGLDSIVTDTDEFSSVLHPGLKVRAHTTVHLQGDSLVGQTIARYNKKGADSLVVLRTEGVRQ